MGSLLSVMAKEMDAWQIEQKYFTCDPSGEIRASLDIQYDFYPKESVDVSDRTDQHAGMGDDMPRVTKDQWQAERDKQKGGEWKRHRAGRNQPVNAGVRVEVKLRCGDVQQGNAHEFIWLHSECDVAANIMQYRVISQPQAEEVEMKGPFVAKASYQESTEIVLDDFIESGTWHEDQIDGPIKWRDTVNELNAYIEEFTRERESLINRLAEEGFALIPAMTAVMGVADVSAAIPSHEWTDGDIVRCVDVGLSCAALTVGKEYTVVTRHGETGVIDDEDDHMCSCIDVGELEFVRRP